MSMQTGPSLSAPQPSTFYVCLDDMACGLRFPVNAGDPFPKCCPRCGGAVQQCATVIPPTKPAARPAQPPSGIQLLLDNWRSIFNVGAAFRTADGAGLNHLYLCGISATPATQPKLAKTALGAERTVAWNYAPNAVYLAHSLQARGMQIWVLEQGHGSTSLFDIKASDLAQGMVLVAGNEVAGVDPGLLAFAHQVIHLPMAGYKESLNVAVATSVAAYWLRALEVAALADMAPARNHNHVQEMVRKQ